MKHSPWYRFWIWPQPSWIFHYIDFLNLGSLMTTFYEATLCIPLSFPSPSFLSRLAKSHPSLTQRLLVQNCSTRNTWKTLTSWKMLKAFKAVRISWLNYWWLVKLIWGLWTVWAMKIWKHFVINLTSRASQGITIVQGLAFLLYMWPYYWPYTEVWKTKKYGEIWHLWFISMSGGVL